MIGFSSTIRIGILTLLGTATLLVSILYAAVQLSPPEVDLLPPDPEIVDIVPHGVAEDNDPRLYYKKGDWERYLSEQEDYSYYQRKKGRTTLYREGEVDIQSYGSIDAGLSYGGSLYTNDAYKKSDTDVATSKIISSGLTPEQLIKVHIEGHVGPRLTLYLDHDSRKKDNTYRMNYRAVSDDELIQELNAGEIDISFNHSKYAVFDNSTSKGLGVELTLRKKRFSLKLFGSVLQGQSETEYFKGNTSSHVKELAEYSFIKRKYYQIEPFKRYDNYDTTGALPADYYTTNTLASTSSTVYNVNLEQSGFALYMDDQVGDNNQYATHVTANSGTIDYGYYDKLVQGTHYTVNYTTGVITFLSIPRKQSRIFAVYTRSSTSDPGAIPSGSTEHPGGTFAGKYMVFIKWGQATHEDRDKDSILDSGEDANEDGKLNLDIYEIRSYYSLGSTDLSTESFSLAFYKQGNKLTQSDIDDLGSYSINYTNGIIHFVRREPFKQLLSTDHVNYIYTEAQPLSITSHSRFSMKSDFYTKTRNFKLKHENIVNNSVEVKINGQSLSKNLFVVEHTSGYIQFPKENNPVITQTTEIEIHYQYMPSGNSSQAFMAGARAEYKFSREFTLGLSALYSDVLGKSVIPQVGDEPERNILIGADARLYVTDKKMSEVFGKLAKNPALNVPVQVKMYGEFDYNFKSTNTFSRGLVDNFESPGQEISLSMSEKAWILSSIPSGTRGLLNYYYYRNPASPETLQTLSYTPTAIAYSTKSGPFNVAAGHLADGVKLQSEQVSLVFDFDFSGGADIVSVVNTSTGKNPVDLSGLQYVEITYRVEGGGSVDLSFDLGIINEDSDGDGTLDTEDTNGDGLLSSGEDIGYAFGSTTRVGNGTGLTTFLTGDGVLNSEDLDGNGQLETTESVMELSSTTLSGSTWKTVRIQIDPDDLSDYPVLSSVEAIRLNLKKTAQDTGRVYIDSIVFVSSSWNSVDKKVSSDTFNVSFVNSLSDTAYGAAAFHILNSDLYKHLYGSKTSEEMSAESETALQIEYSLASSTSYASVRRTFSKPIDLRYYNSMHVWFYPNAGVNTSDTIYIRIGSSDTDYVEYTSAMPTADVWNEVVLKLNSESTGTLTGTTTGSPDMRNIRFIDLGVTSTGGSSSGTLWVNDIYVSEPQELQGHAHWAEAEVAVTKPLFITKDGVPVLSDFVLRYIKRGNSAYFDSIGKEDNELSEDRHEVYSSFEILPSWRTVFNFIYNGTSTDSNNLDVSSDLRGNVVNQTIFAKTGYESTGNGIPTVLLQYRNVDYSKRAVESVDGAQGSRYTTRNTHAPVFKITELYKNKKFGKIKAAVSLNLLFKDEQDRRTGTDAFAYSEQRQKNDVNLLIEYSNSYFFIKPSFSVDTEEVVNYQGSSDTTSSEITSDVLGTYHLPFSTSSDMKLVNRNMKGSFSLGMTDFWFISPQYNIDLTYYENSFRDYDFSAFSGVDFSRLKNAQSYVSSRIDIPILLSKVKGLEFFKNFSFGYHRNVYLSETDVPYEGEGLTTFDEEYGISRSFSSILNPGLNIFQFFPGYFFGGRRNFGNGRDLVYNLLNSVPSDTSGTPLSDYSNTIKLTDSFLFNLKMDFDSVTSRTTFSFSQVAERSALQSIPGQVISASVNTSLNLDLMKLVNKGFFSLENRIKKKHSFSIDVGYSFAANLLITSNIENFTHTPRLGFTIKWGRSFVSLNTGFTIVHEEYHEYISSDSALRSPIDSIYYDNMTVKSGYGKIDFGFDLTLIWETDVKWLYDLFKKGYRLVSYPIFNISYSTAINRYDYFTTVSPEPYDSHVWAMSLSMDLHKNVRGGLKNKLVLEQYRDSTTSEITKEVFSYEVSLKFSLVF